MEPPVDGPHLLVRAINYFRPTVFGMETKLKGLWFIQLLEYAIGFALAYSAVHATRPVIPAALALLVIANAATVNGPLSAFRVTSVRAHRVLGVLISLGVVATAVLVSNDMTGRATLIVAAIAEGFVSVRFKHGI